MEATQTTLPEVTPVEPQKASNGLLLQRKCACGGSSGGLTGACDECQHKRLTVQRYSRDREVLAALRSALAPPLNLSLDPGTRRVGDRNALRPLQTIAPRRVQTKLTVGQSTKPNEQPADPAAERVVGGSAPGLNDQSPIPAPEQPEIAPDAAEEETSSGKRTASDVAAATAPATAETPEPETPTPAGLIVEDDAQQVGPSQMRKSEFLDEVQSAVCAAADAELAAVGQTTEGCPYVERWIGYYRTRSIDQVERALRRYAPEAAGITNAHDYIPFVAERVRRAVAVWANTGQITGVPSELAGVLPVSSAAGPRSGASILPKAREGGVREAGDPREIRSQLGAGSSLDGSTRARMESAFGHDFSNVRVHTDSAAAGLSSSLNARAFTIGSDVAFGAGEYQPGTLIGDALMAHELAHVVQQAGATSPGPLTKDATTYNDMEEDADRSAVSAVVSLWTGVKGALAGLADNAMPALRSGLGLQRCKKETCSEGNKTISIDLVKLRGATRTPATDLAEANKIYKPCCVQFSKGVDQPAPNDKSDLWLGGDTDLKWDTQCGLEAEEKAMWDGATTEFKLSSRMRAFYVDTLNPTSARAYSRPPFCATGKASPYVNHIVVSNSGSNDTLAHELGHVLLNSGDHHGIDNPADTKNLMLSPGRTGSDLDASQCKIIYNNA